MGSEGLLIVPHIWRNGNCAQKGAKQQNARRLGGEQGNWMIQGWFRSVELRAHRIREKREREAVGE